MMDDGACDSTEAHSLSAVQEVHHSPCHLSWQAREEEPPGGVPLLLHGVSQLMLELAGMGALQERGN